MSLGASPLTANREMAAIQDCWDRAHDPFHKDWSSPVCLRRAAETLQAYLKTNPLNEQTFRAQILAIDGQIQAGLRILNPTNVKGLLKDMDHALHAAVTLPRSDALTQFMGYAKALFYYRAASYVLLLMKKATGTDFTRMTLALSTSVVALRILVSVAQTSATWAAERAMLILEINALIASNFDTGFVQHTAMLSAIADPQTPHNLFNVVFGAAESNEASFLWQTPMEGSLAHSELFTINDKNDYISKLIPVARHPHFLKRLQWLMNVDPSLLEPPMMIVDILFPRLSLSVDNLKSNAIESLSRIDIKVFLVSVHTATLLRQRSKAIRRTGDSFHSRLGRGSVESNSTIVYPPFLSDIPLDEAQSKFWTAVVALTATPPSRDNELRLAIQEGLECLRLCQRIASDIRFVDAVAGWLILAGESETDPDATAKYYQWALLYNKVLLDMIERDQLASGRLRDLFAMVLASPTPIELAEMDSRARIFIAERELADGNAERALNTINKLDSIQARELQYQIMVNLAGNAKDKETGDYYRSKAEQLRPGGGNRPATVMPALISPRASNNESMGNVASPAVSISPIRSPHRALFGQEASESPSLSRFRSSLNDSTTGQTEVLKLQKEINEQLNAEMQKLRLDLEKARETTEQVRAQERDRCERIVAEMNERREREVAAERERARLESEKAEERFQRVQQHLHELTLSPSSLLRQQLAPSMATYAAAQSPSQFFNQSAPLRPMPSADQAAILMANIQQQQQTAAMIQQQQQYLRDNEIVAGGPYGSPVHQSIQQQQLSGYPLSQPTLPMNMTGYLGGIGGGMGQQQPVVSAPSANVQQQPNALIFSMPIDRQPQPAPAHQQGGGIFGQPQLAPATTMALYTPPHALHPAPPIFSGIGIVTTKPAGTTTLTTASFASAPTTTAGDVNMFKGFQLSVPKTVAGTTTAGAKTTTATSNTTTSIFGNQFSTPPKPNNPLVFGQPTTNIGSSPAASTPPGGPPMRNRAESETSGGEPEHFEPQVEFQPLIPLPELVEVITGEEDEQTVFADRVKLYRYVTETSEWKERGIGELKILRNPKTNRYRVVMRREQVHKVCANHPITGEMQLQPMTKSDRAWTWFARDFTPDDENPAIAIEGRDEKFAAKFKSPEVAKKFQTTFETGRSASASSPAKPTSQGKFTGASKPTAAASSTTAPAQGFGDKFKPAAGSWQCNGCYVQNKATDEKCVCCGTNKDGTTGGGNANQSLSSSTGGGIFSSKPTAAIAPSSSQSYSFGFDANAALGATTTQPVNMARTAATTTTTASPRPIFGIAPTVAATSKGTIPTTTTAAAIVTTAPSTAAVTTTTSTTPSPSGFAGFKFGTSTLSSATRIPVPTAASPARTDLTNQPVFGSTSGLVSPAVTPAGGNSFAALASSGQSIFAKKEGTPTMTFGGLATAGPSKLFSNYRTPTSSTATNNSTTSSGTPTAPAAGGRRESETSAGEPEPEQYEPEVDFKPLIPLPELVEVRTGEENEDILFQERSKLYRFTKETGKDTGEWKERGVGVLKILHNPKTKKCRIVMRRDQVLKLCANHGLAKPMALTPMKNSDKSWSWSAQDYSEGEGRDEMLAAKFKSPELAKQFADVFEACVDGKAETLVLVSKAENGNNQPAASSCTMKSEAEKSNLFGEGTKKSLFGGSTMPQQATSPVASMSFQSTQSVASSKASASSPVNFSFKSPLLPSPATASGQSSKLGQQTLSLEQKENLEKYSLPKDFYAGAHSHSDSTQQCVGCRTDEDQERALRQLDRQADAPDEEEEEHYEEGDGEDDDDQYEDDDDEEYGEEPSVIFESAAQLIWQPADVSPLKAKASGVKPVAGQVHIEYDEDATIYRVIFVAEGGEDGEMLMNQPIVAEDTIKTSDKKSSPWTAEWVGVDFAKDVEERKAFHLIFNNAKSRDEFVKQFRTSVDQAKHNDIHRYSPTSRDLEENEDYMSSLDAANRYQSGGGDQSGK